MTEINNLMVPSNFSFFEHITPTNKSFSWKIAILNTMSFCLIAGVDTYNYRLLQTQNNNIPLCPWDYWVLLWAMLLVPGNYLLSRTNRWIIQVLSPYLFTVGTSWFVSLINFRTSSGNLSLIQLLAFALFPSLGFVASVIRYYIPRTLNETNLDGVDLQARIHWITENINMWRTLAITIMTAIIVFIAFWLKATWDWAISAFDREKQGPVMQLIAIQATGIAVYVFLGPIYECFRKAEHIRNMLLEIKKEATKNI